MVEASWWVKPLMTIFLHQAMAGTLIPPSHVEPLPHLRIPELPSRSRFFMLKSGLNLDLHLCYVMCVYVHIWFKHKVLIDV